MTLNVLSRIDYLLNLCNDYLDNDSNLMPVISLQTVSNETMEFMQSYTKQTKFELIKKINLFRNKALKVFDYGCIRGGRFTVPRIISSPNWITDIKPMLLSSSPEQVLFLDIGCCFGADIRYLINMGCKINQLYGVDIENGFINLGFEYFSDYKLLKNTFISMNILDDKGAKFINYILNMNNNKLFDIIQIANVYHLLNEEEGKILMKIAISLIKKSNGIIFGSAMGSKIEGISYRKDKLRYLHSAKSFESLMKEYGNFNTISITTEDMKRRIRRSNVSPKLLTHFTTPPNAMIFTFFAKT